MIASEDSERRFASFVEGLVEVIGHADRAAPLRDYCLGLLVPILEKHVGGTAGVDVGVAVNPEFLREGTSVRDFFDPPKTVIGELDAASGDVVAKLYEGLPGDVFRVPVPTA